MKTMKFMIAMLLFANTAACASATTNYAVRIVNDAGQPVKDAQVHATYRGVKVLSHSSTR